MSDFEQRKNLEQNKETINEENKEKPKDVNDSNNSIMSSLLGKIFGSANHD